MSYRSIPGEKGTFPVSDASTLSRNVHTCQGSILIFEDDEVYGQTIGSVLRNAGYDVTVVGHFQPALEMLSGSEPLDLLIADIVVPQGVNGMALSRMARMRRRDLKIIYITGYDLPGAEQEALGPILRKPIPEEVLLSEVTRALRAD